jgi:hypothetical protein
MSRPHNTWRHRQPPATQRAPAAASRHPRLARLQFPKSAFEHAQSLAVGFNELVDAIARDPAWLKATLAA